MGDSALPLPLRRAAGRVLDTAHGVRQAGNRHLPRGTHHRLRFRHRCARRPLVYDIPGAHAARRTGRRRTRARGRLRGPAHAAIRDHAVAVSAAAQSRGLAESIRCLRPGIRRISGDYGIMGCDREADLRICGRARRARLRGGVERRQGGDRHATDGDPKHARPHRCSDPCRRRPSNRRRDIGAGAATYQASQQKSLRRPSRDGAALRWRSSLRRGADRCLARGPCRHGADELASNGGRASRRPLDLDERGDDARARGDRSALGMGAGRAR